MAEREREKNANTSERERLTEKDTAEESKQTQSERQTDNIGDVLVTRKQFLRCSFNT